MMAGSRAAPLLLLACVLIAGAVGLWPELSISRVDLNDNVFHFGLIQGMARAAERGSPLDFWSPEWSLGYPVLRTYQPLAHALVVLVYFASAKTLSLMTVFVWARFLSVLLLPLTFFVTARLLSLEWWEAAAASLLAPLVSTNFLYGVEYGSYLWAGSGLFTQAVATHFLLLAIGFGFAAIRRGRRLGWCALFLALTFLSHFIYGYIAAVTLCLLAFLPDRETPRRPRILRTLWIGAIALLLSAFQLVPMLQDGGFINHSRWEPTWKWDSFGAWQVLKMLFTGELLDHGRLPVLSLLALAGIVVWFWDYRHKRRLHLAGTFVVSGALLWLLMFFGRPFWGPSLKMLGVPEDMQVHRVIGGAHVFLVLAAAIGLAALWRWLAARWHFAAAVAVTALLLYPMIRERAHLLSDNAVWGRRNLAEYHENRNAIDAVIARVRERGGRVYPGLAAGWGGKFKVGDVPFYAFLSRAEVPAVAFLYHSMALTGDVMVRFDEMDPTHYLLFNIRSVIAPAEGVALPPFLAPRERIGPFRIFDAPGVGYFDVVDAPFAVHTTRDNFYDVNDRWLHSDQAARKQHLRLDLYGDQTQAPRLDPEQQLFPAFSMGVAGFVASERQDGGSFEAQVQALRPSFALFRMTWHPNWKAYVDGRPEPTLMLSPGFVGLPLTPGPHKIVCRYEADHAKAILLLGGCLLALVLARVGPRPVLWKWAQHAVPRRVAVAAGLVALALPVAVSLITPRLPDGHDALEYFPRLEEFHENISHGILFPRWAPDLSRGTGQPLFEFNPPVIYYLSEFWHLAGFDFLTSVNLAAVTLVLASAAGMFLLCRLYFGPWGGWFGTAAYLYAPYFAVDLYVRSALAEFAAFPFFALTLYGFGAYAKTGKRGYLLAGAAAYAGVLASHNAAALLFTPLLIAFLVFTAWTAHSWRLLRHQAYGFLLGLGLGACVWLPSLAERQYVGLARLLEGYLNYKNHFVYMHQLFYSPWGYGISVAGDQDGMSFALGWSHLLLAATAAIWILWSRRRGHLRRVSFGAMPCTHAHAEWPWLWFFAGAAAGLAILMLDVAAPLWDRMPLLQMVEFPWRLLGPVTLCVALLVAPLGALIGTLPRWRAGAAIAALALLILPGLAHCQPWRFRDMDLTLWTPQRIAMRGIEVTTAAEYVPRWVKTWPAYDPRPARIPGGEVVVWQGRLTPVSWSGRIRTAAGGTAEMPIAWFPGWVVRIDGSPVSTQPADPTGLIRFRVPAGEHTLDAEWTRTPPRRLADGISLLSLGILLVLAIRTVRPGPRLPPA